MRVLRPGKLTIGVNVVDTALALHVTLGKSLLKPSCPLWSSGVHQSAPAAFCPPSALGPGLVFVVPGFVLWRSPALENSLWEAHVAMFTRKHSVPLRACCSRSKP